MLPKLIDGTRNPWYKCATFVTGNPLIGNWNGGEGVETMLTREEFIANERRKLLDEEQQTSAALERLHESLREEVDVDAEEGDPDLIEREKNVALANQQEYKLEGIRAALRAIDKGTYGLCERCGKEIGVERLEVKPDATLCVQCQAEVEKLIRRGALPRVPQEIL
jgi:DnaK suppressor protein